MSFDFHPGKMERPAHRVAGLLIPLGAVVSLLPWTPPWAALLGGIVLSLTLGNPYADTTHRASKWLEQLAVVSLGAGVNLMVGAHVGGQGLG